MAAKSSQPRRLPRVGETFAVPLGPAGFGVVRVLRTVHERGRNSALVAVTPWLAPHIPEVHEPLLRQVLCLHRGNCGGRVALCWYDGSVPAELQSIGIILPTDEELAIDPRGTYGGSWGRNVAHDVLRERGLPVEPVPVPPQEDVDRVTGVMSEDEFWRAIALVDWDGDTGEEVVAPLLDHLAGLPVASIAGFHRKLSEKLFQLDREEFAREIGAYSFGSSQGFSADHFLDVRCAAVAQGRKFYTTLLSDSSKMVRDRELEALANVAEEAYVRKIGRNVVFLGAKPYETFSNAKGWPANEG